MTRVSANATPQQIKDAKDMKGSGLKHKGKGKGDKDGKGKKRRGGGGRYGAHGGYKGVKRGRARRLVNAELNPLLRQLTREIGQSNRLYERTKGDLNHIYNESGQYIDAQNDQVAQSFASAAQQQNAAQQALMSQLAQTGQQSAGSAGDELSRLGLGNPEFLGQLQSDQQNAMRMAQQVGANNQANLGLTQAGMTSVGELLGSMNKGSQTSALGQARIARNNEVNDIRGQRRELRAQRPELMLKMLEQMAAQGWGQHVDSRNLAMQQQQINMQRRSQAQSQARYQAGQSQQNAYNSTLSSLYQQQLANTYGR